MCASFNRPQLSNIFHLTGTLQINSHAFLLIFFSSFLEYKKLINSEEVLKNRKKESEYRQTDSPSKNSI